MKPLLLFKNKEPDFQQELPWNAQLLMQDLELDTLFGTMASGNAFMYEVMKKVVLSGMYTDMETILYRQDIMKDCLQNPNVIQEIYKLTTEAITKEKHDFWGIFSKYPSSILNHSRAVLFMLTDTLMQLRTTADLHGDKFRSEGFRRFFSMVQTELSEAYLHQVVEHLKELKLTEGVLMSSELGKGNKATNLTLNKIHTKHLPWPQRFIDNYVTRKTIELEGKQNLLLRFIGHKPSGFTFFINARDESGIRALYTIKDEGINLVANAVAQSADHILGFFKMLQSELAFYIGCIHLYEKLKELNEPVAFPVPQEANKRSHRFDELYDICLALTLNQKVVGNTLFAPGKELFVITGANQGGKSTFLRSIGVAQLMMQSGMFVPAGNFSANICKMICTHYKREEDSGLKSGKLDEELSRISDIIDHLDAHSLILFNESLAATNEREGSRIAGEIVKALIEKHIKVFFVTHMYEFANDFYSQQLPNAIFLTANRQKDKKRTYKITEGKPLKTSFGSDLYQVIFQTG